MGIIYIHISEKEIEIPKGLYDTVLFYHKYQCLCLESGLSKPEKVDRRKSFNLVDFPKCPYSYSNSSAQGLLASQELYQYILETSVYPREPEPLKEIREATADHPRGCIATTPEGGQLMALLLKLVHARRTIEIGVFTGYSVLLTALVLPEDGKITAIDPDREAYEIGLPIIRKAGVEHKIDFIHSHGLTILDKILQDPKSEGSYDFAYVDADKENYINYHERLMKLVKVGGLIVYDNTLWRGTVAYSESSLSNTCKFSEEVLSKVEFVKELNKVLAADSRIQMTQLPVGDGVTICMRLY